MPPIKPVTEPVIDPAKPSNFATRRAERLARGDAPAESRKFAFRAGVDAETPKLVVAHVSA